MAKKKQEAQDQGNLVGSALRHRAGCPGQSSSCESLSMFSRSGWTAGALDGLLCAASPRSHSCSREMLLVRAWVVAGPQIQK